MRAPARPENEEARLAVLRSYEILDTSSEAAFDAITKLAAEILNVPIALVSLVDADRQWFKSRYGLEARETPRDISFCGHVVADGSPLVVGDARTDDRFTGNPLVEGDPKIRFYAGMPLRTLDGFVLGTLCALDPEPHQPTPKQLEMLELLAGLVVNQLESHRRRRLMDVERTAALAKHLELEVLFEAMAEGVVVQDATGVIVSANASATRILGLSMDELQGRTSVDPSWRSVHEDGSPFPGDTHPAMVTLATGEKSSNIIMGVHKPSGELTWISINALPLRDGDDRIYGVVTTFHDISTIKNAQLTAERLAQQEHLITTGTLAAGVGHEINNPLTFVLANLDFALEDVRAIGGGSPSNRIRELLEILSEARDGAERVRKIVRGLRSLAREESEPVPIDVSGVIDTSVNMAAHELRQKATVVRNLTTTRFAVADESRLTQVIVNLLVNAAHAFPTGDFSKNRIVVTTKEAEGDRIVITVADNGPGIPEQLQRRIFDPFFTTKPVGQGLGLGLSICRSIVTALDGQLTLHSTEGHGTTFEIDLPAAAAAPSPEQSERPAGPAPFGRVLIVDDEPAILSTLKRALERSHDVVAIGNSAEALELLQRGERFDVIFCDIMMPLLWGDELYARVRESHPEQAERFVFMTGGAKNPRVQSFLESISNERLDKPFKLEKVREIARRLVARPLAGPKT